MINLLTSSQMHEADANASVSSIKLMEQAATAFVKVFKQHYPNQLMPISILCGQGNNGGDGLAIARLLQDDGYKDISVYLIEFGEQHSKDRAENLVRLAKTKIKRHLIADPAQFENCNSTLIIDAILGSGLNRPLTDKYALLANKVNKLGKTIVAVDVPTGFPTEGPIDMNYVGIKAQLVICFQRPKINFFFPESIQAIAQFQVVDIGLNEDFIAHLPSSWKLISEPNIKPRNNFTHKGSYGHVLITAGNVNTMGAALLAARACLHSGAGLTTLCLPQSGLIALNTALPEVMALPRNERLQPHTFEKFNAFAIGPGLGIEKESEVLLTQLIDLEKPMVIDADALNILATRKDLFDRLAEQTILTPHIKEFDRLFGDHETWWERVETAKQNAQERKLIIVLKNQYTFICLPNGEVNINQTGNPGMASGGMGDVLTGMIVGFMAQSYSSADAAKLAVYVHGKAGDELVKTRFTVTATQVANQIPKTINTIR